jgi:lipid II:glycine glycyltransferase (peptidoglycan interpeptide bridge formation enzyme)
LGLTLAYIPKGPVSGVESRQVYQSWKTLWPEVDAACRKRRCVFLKVEPDLWEGEAPEIQPAGFQLSPHTIQPPRTIVLDLTGTEEQVLSRMKQKTRYNIRLAIKKGVVVRHSSDVNLFFQIIQATGERDRFGVHSREYYQRSFDLFHNRGECELLLAELEGEPLAALMAFTHGARAWYFYGASVSSHRDTMPTYLLQWEAMRWARRQGCTEYDLWGVPDCSEEDLEANFTRRSNGLWGVYRFKRGFGGQLCRSAGPWDRVYQPFLYRLYRLWMKRTG